MKKLQGGLSPYMLGLVFGVTIVSTLTANQARLQNQQYEEKYLKEKQAYAEKLVESLENNVIVETTTSNSTFDSTKAQSYIYTNIFNTKGSNVNVASGTQADGQKIVAATVDSNSYNVNQATSAAAANNSLTQDYSGKSSAIFNESKIREQQISYSYDNMKKQAELLYNEFLNGTDKIWPCAVSITLKDAWNRLFTIQRVDDFTLNISFNLPWDDTSIKTLTLKVPEVVLPDEEIVEINSKSENSAFFRTTSGDIWGAGYNYYYNLGLDDRSDIISWTNSNISNVKELVTVSNTESYALLNNNELWVTGRNSNGELGLGHQNLQTKWIKSIDNVKSFTVSTVGDVYVIKNDGSLWVTGPNSHGQLGVGHNTLVTEWTQVTGLTAAKKVYAINFGTQSSYFAYVVLDNGELWATGFNEDGQLGLGNKNNTYTWSKTNLTNVNKIKFTIDGIRSVFAIKEDGTAWGVGYGANGIFGDNKAGSQVTKSSWEQVAVDVKDVILGNGSAYLIKNNGDLFVTGSNSSGQLGLGHNNAVLLWTDTNLKNVKKVELGLGSNAFVIDGNNDLWVTGANSNGILGIGSSSQTFVKALSNVKNIEAGRESSVFVLKNDGTVWASGSNMYGQLGLGNKTNIDTWSQMIGVSNINTIADTYGWDHYSLYMLDTTGDLWAVGRNRNGEFGNGNKTDQSIANKVFRKNELTGSGC